MRHVGGGEKNIARADRAFLGRVVRFLAGEAGVRQFLDVGTGLPTADNTHEVAQRAAPQARVVYVDSDPLVLAHARALLAPDRNCGVVDADLRDPVALLDQAAGLLDFELPVAVLLLAVLPFVSDADGPAGIVAKLADALAPRSVIVISALTADCAPVPVATGTAAWNAAVTTAPSSIVSEMMSPATPVPEIVGAGGTPATLTMNVSVAAAEDAPPVAAA